MYSMCVMSLMCEICVMYPEKLRYWSSCHRYAACYIPVWTSELSVDLLSGVERLVDMLIQQSNRLSDV